LTAWFDARLSPLKPGPRAWAGATAGILLAGTLACLTAAGDLRFGFGRGVDLTLSVAIHVLGVILCAAIFMAVTWLVRCVPSRVIGSLGGAMAAFLLFQIAWHGLDPRIWIVALLLPIEGLLGLALGTIIGGEMVRAPRARNIATVTTLVLGLGINLALVAWLLGDGSNHHLLAAAPSRTGVAHLAAPNPSQRGSFAVKTLTYGSGNDQRRAEFGDTVVLRTPTVDASGLLPELKGFHRAAREWYWDFDVTHFPLNGRVWYPEGAGPFPLVLVVHGNHVMEEFSDAGYAYLCEHLASRGFVSVSVDENFLNDTWSGSLAGKELPARAWMLLEHLKQWRGWNAEVGNPLHGKIDLEKIALVGHSRGGEAAAIAAVFNRLSRYPDNALVRGDFSFPIKAIVALAPSSGFYKPSGEPPKIANIDYLVIQGAHDADVATFLGTRQYHHVKFTQGDPHFKCALYIDRASHGHFNTIWGARDWGGPAHLLQNVKPVIAGDEQRQIAKVCIAAFVEASLHGKREYLAIFRDPRAAAQGLPGGIRYVAQYNDSSFTPICDFEEDIDVTTATWSAASVDARGVSEWRETQAPLRFREESQENKAVFLKWNKPSADSHEGDVEYHIALPKRPVQLGLETSPSTLRFALAQAEDSDRVVNFTIRLHGRDGVVVECPADAIGPVIRTQISKIPWIEGMLLKPFEVVFRTFELPLNELAKHEPRWNPSDLSAITFRFDSRHAGAIYLDDVGFARAFPP
jgi:dienelactone hydrolase